MSFAKIGRQGLLLFVGLLPWSVLISVFGGDQLGFGLFHFWKEIFLIFLLGVFLLDCMRKKYVFSWDILDLSVVLYIFWMIVISVFNHAQSLAYIYGLRYDAEFLIAFVFLRRCIAVWGVSMTSLARVFLISGGLMLTMSVLIRYVFGETFLTIFGFSGLVGSADVSGPPPIYHDIADSSIVRFQGVLEGPNQMAFFLVVYSAIYATILMKMRKYRVINTVVCIAVGFLFLETYSRSAYIGIFVGLINTIVLALMTLIRNGNNTRVLYDFFKKFFIPVLLLAVVFTGVLFQFRGQFYSIFDRHGSTTGHYERMMIGLTRFLEKPMGSGLAQAGPASRGIVDVNDRLIPANTIKVASLQKLVLQLRQKNKDFYFNTSNYYIPESWYIQQLVEGGIIGGFLFVVLLFLILGRLRRYQYLFGAFVAIMLMNIFLHSFESVHTVLVFFIFLASVLPVQSGKINFGKSLHSLFGVFIFLLPWHALVITFMQCRAHLDVTFVRFWKELFVGVFFILAAGTLLMREKWNISSWHKTRPILFWVGLFLISSGLYLFIPTLHIESQAFLGFRYDVFFLLALIIGMGLPQLAQYNRFLLKVLFASTALVLAIFLIWYSFFDIATTTIFGFSSEVSTFHPTACLAFAQNVSGHHRLQATFGGPIRFSVFVVMTYILSLGFLGTTVMRRWIKYTLLAVVSFVVFVAVFYSYSKTSYLGLAVGLILYAAISARFLTGKAKIFSKKYIILGGALLLIVMSGIMYMKRDLFLHGGSTLVRQGNLTKTATMFLHKPFGYGLGTAGPASQIEGSGGVDFVEAKTDFLPENWYLQILIEQGIIGLGLFVMVLIFIGRALWKILSNEKDAYSIALFSAFCTLLFMGFFTHVFEEAATSYTIFLFIGLHLSASHKKIVGK